MEYKKKCNVCGKVFCYTDEDLKKNATNAGLGALSALGSLASSFGGGSIFHTHHLQGQADRFTDQIVNYDQCPYCHSRDLSVFTGSTEDTKAVKTVNINTSASTESLLKRVFIFLEDGDWETADAYCEACLDTDPESAKAYLGKLMAELHVKTQDELKYQPKPYDGNSNYKKAYRYADDELKCTLIGYIEHINNRNENERKNKILYEATKKMTGKVISDYEEALKLLESITGWKNADEKKSICLKKITELKEQEESDRLELLRLAELERIKAEEEAEIARIEAQKNKKIAAIVVPILVILVVATVMIFGMVKKNNAYHDALTLMDAGQYEEAIEIFSTLDGYKDSANNIEEAERALNNAEMEAQYLEAVNKYETYEYTDAKVIFESLQEYKDSQSYVLQCEYGIAYLQALDNEKIDVRLAYEIYETLPSDYLDVTERMANIAPLLDFYGDYYLQKEDARFNQYFTIVSIFYDDHDDLYMTYYNHAYSNEIQKDALVDTDGVYAFNRSTVSVRDSETGENRSEESICYLSSGKIISKYPLRSEDWIYLKEE